MRSENARDVLIIGGGVTGLTLALSLREAGIPCRVFEAATELKWLGVGINLLPHAVRELTVLASRSISPDTVLRVVHERTGDKPFGRIEDVVSEAELAALMEKYKRVAGFEREALKSRPSLVSP